MVTFKRRLFAYSESKIHFHAPILAEDIISDAMQFDIGIALELKDFMNSNLCVSNKTFAYLMAGLAIIGNDTIGQKDIFSHFPDAAAICDLNDVSSLTSAMQYYIENPEQLAGAKRLARKAAISATRSPWWTSNPTSAALR